MFFSSPCSISNLPAKNLCMIGGTTRLHYSQKLMNDPHVKTVPWFRGSIIATIITGAITVLYYFFLPALLRLFAGFYLSRNDP
jgi:antibiotic biosynthesis monooxygenase (ABM) superfamily enzyme